jgi:arabinogalactan oligomer/maltooligosaccharide transport system substrate-binding protein
VARNGNVKSDIKTTASASAVRPAATLANVVIYKTTGHATGNILYWNAVENAKLYQVYRLQSGSWTLLKNTGSLAYKDETAPAGVKSYYKIVARNGDIKSDIKTTASVGVTRPAALTKLDNVTITKAVPHATGNILYWDAVKNAKIYQVYRLCSGETSWNLLTNTGSLAYKDTDAPFDIKCYYKIVARNGDIKSDIKTTASYGVTRPMSDVQEITLKIWAPSYDIENYDSWLCVQMRAFEAAHPEYSITWICESVHEADAGYAAIADPMAAADVFMYANDQLSMLADAGALLPIGGSYLDQVQNDNSTTMIQSVTHTNGFVYGFPYSSNTWFMYYDKSVYSEEDVKSLETMLEKGVVSFPLTNGWYNWSFYAAAGGTMFGPTGNDVSAGIVLGENGTAVTKYLVELAQHPNFRNDAWVDSFYTGEINAMFSGCWDSVNVKNALGDNMGVAQLPTITLNGEQKQLKAFAGSKAVGVNSHSKYPQAALQFAAFISTPEAQKAHYEAWGIIPCANALLNDPVIMSDPVARAQMNTIANASTVQPTLPEMVSYWTPAQNMGYNILDGWVTNDNAAEMTREFEDAINNR